MFSEPFQPTLMPEGQRYFGLTLNWQKPCAALTDSVYAFGQVRVEHATPYPVIPDGSNMLFFSTCGESFGGAQSSILEVQLTQPKTEYFAIWFKPGAIHRHFNVDLADVTNQVTSLEFLESRTFLALFERLYELTDFQQRIQYCESLLLKQTCVQALPNPLKQALEGIQADSGVTNIQQLANSVGWSSRHLNRQFQLYTGLTSKSFAQTVRLNQFLKRCYQQRTSPLYHGLDLGFYDHSHLAKSLAQQGHRTLSPVAKHFMSDFYKLASN